jgi:hypothetical protein
MSIRKNTKKDLLMAALAGAALTYGALYFTADNSIERDQQLALKQKIQDLELLVAQQENALNSARDFAFNSLAVVTSNPGSNQLPQKTAKNSARINNQEDLPLPENTTATTAPDNQQLVKDLVTLSDRDPRNFAEKLNDFLTQQTSKENVAIASKAVFDMAGNSDIAPDYELLSLYQDQRDPEIKRVIAQVLSTRGDNSLIEKHIADAQAGLRSEDATTRQQTLVALAKTHYAGAANAIVPLLQDQSTGVKLDALLALRATGNQSHIYQVQKLMNDPDPSVSWLAKDVISNLKNLSENARTSLASNDIASELPPLSVQ